VRNEQDGFSEVAGNDGVRGPPHPRRHFVERFTSGEALAHGLHIRTALADTFAGRLRCRVPHEPENCSVFGHDSLACRKENQHETLDQLDAGTQCVAGKPANSPAAQPCPRAREANLA